MKRTWLVAVGVAALAVVACSGSKVDDLGPAPDGGSVSVTGAPTYHQDVQPILEAKCTMCHAAGGIAPFSLTSAEDATRYASTIKEQTSARTMPPWPPGAASPPMLHERKLTDAQIATLVAWADGGAQVGDQANPGAPLPREVAEFGKPDLVADIGVDYVPDTALTDDYRCFLIDLKQAEERVATGFRLTPGNRKSVHHVITTVYDAASRAKLEALDKETPARAGWPCVGGPVPEGATGVKAVSALGSWVPGVDVVKFPAGTGNSVPAGSLAVMQVHYNLHGGIEPDRTKIEVVFAPKGTEASLQRLATVRLLKYALSIPPEVKDVVAEQSLTANQWAGGKSYPNNEAYVLLVAGHMHTLGTQIRLQITNAAGTSTALEIPAWNFHWQGAYELAKPIKIASTDTLSIRCIYNNTAARRAEVGYSAAPSLVTWGEGTEDEMCIGYMTVVNKLPTP